MSYDILDDRTRLQQVLGHITIYNLKKPLYSLCVVLLSMFIVSKLCKLFFVNNLNIPKEIMLFLVVSYLVFLVMMLFYNFTVLKLIVLHLVKFDLEDIGRSDGVRGFVRGNLDSVIDLAHVYAGSWMVVTSSCITSIIYTGHYTIILLRSFPIGVVLVDHILKK